MMLLKDMDYRRDKENPEHGGANERYIGYLDNGDLLELRHYGYYASRTNWEWAVFVPDDYPVQCYQKGGVYKNLSSPEGALVDFENEYRPRSWRSRAEIEEAGDVREVRCSRCGWHGSPYDLDQVTVIEDYGDVCCSKCPSCGAVEHDGVELFEEIG